MNADRLRARLATRVLVLDGAMATELAALRLTEEEARGDRFRGHSHDLRASYDALSLSRPDLVRAVHDAYLSAGADIITTNSFRAGAAALEAVGLAGAAYEVNAAAARIARDAADVWSRDAPGQPRLVAGAIGPAAPSSGSGEASRASYREQARGLLDGGADLLLLETCYCPDDTWLALRAIADLVGDGASDPPVMVSMAVTPAGGLPISGATVADFLARTGAAGAFCVGVNCGVGCASLAGAMADVARRASHVTSFHPSAGLPDARGRYPADPATWAAEVRSVAVSARVHIVGGCCGTTPAHTRALVAAVGRLPPGGG